MNISMHENLQSNPHLRAVYEATQKYILSLDANVCETEAQRYRAFKYDFGSKAEGFVEIYFHRLNQKTLDILARLIPTPAELELDFVRNKGPSNQNCRYPCEIKISEFDQLERAKPLLKRAYERKKNRGPGDTDPFPFS